MRMQRVVVGAVGSPWSLWSSRGPHPPGWPMTLCFFPVTDQPSSREAAPGVLRRPPVKLLLRS